MFMMYLSLKPFVTFTFCTSSLLLLAIISQVIIWFCLVSDCHCLTWGIDETMRVSMFQMMSKWRALNSESMFSKCDSMCINGCMFCSIDVMKCIQALAWFCLLRFLLSMQHIYLFLYMLLMLDGHLIFVLFLVKWLLHLWYFTWLNIASRVGWTFRIFRLQSLRRSSTINISRVRETHCFFWVHDISIFYQVNS